MSKIFLVIIVLCGLEGAALGMEAKRGAAVDAPVLVHTVPGLGIRLMRQSASSRIITLEISNENPYRTVSSRALEMAQNALRTQTEAMVKWRICDNKTCGSIGTAKCSGCREAVYCSKDCQAADWRTCHKTACSREFSKK